MRIRVAGATPHAPYIDMYRKAHTYTVNGCTLIPPVMNLSNFRINIDVYIHDQWNDGANKNIFEHGKTYYTTTLVYTSRIGIFKGSTNDRYQFYTSDGDGNTSLGTVTGLTLSVGWHTFSIEATNSTLKFFVDDEQKGSTINNPYLPTERGVFSIGGAYDLNTYTTALGWRNLEILEDTETLLSIPHSAHAEIYSTNPQMVSGIPVAVNKDHYEAWPSIVELENQDLLLAYRTADTNTHGYDATSRIVTKRSTDGGYTWSKHETTIADSAGEDDRDPVMCTYTDANGDEGILLCWCTYDGVFEAGGHYKTYTQTSRDGGVTWTTPVLLGEDRATGANPIQLSNGDLGVVVFEEPTYDTIYINKTSDEGATWTETLIAEAPDSNNKYNETAIIETRNSQGTYTGGLMCITRSEGVNKYTRLTSADYGATWTNQGVMTDLENMVSTKPALFRYNENTLVCSYTQDGQHGLYLSGSTDEGQTFTTFYKVNAPIIGSGGASRYPDTIWISKTGMVGVAYCTNISTSDVFFSIIAPEELPF